MSDMQAILEENKKLRCMLDLVTKSMLAAVVIKSQPSTGQEVKESLPNEADDKITCYIEAQDPRYQTLVLQSELWSAGYSINIEDGALRRICICAAHSSSECCCGAWDTDSLSTK